MATSSGNIGLNETNVPALLATIVQPADYVLCDICDNNIVRYFRCKTCQFGEFDVCEPCLEAGHWCPNIHHELIEIENRSEKGRRVSSSLPREARTKPFSHHFAYDPLPVPKDSRPYIRLMTLQPAKLGEDLRSDIRVWLLDEAPPYEALSYCWGPVQPICFLHLNEKKLAITPNLHSALYHISMTRKNSLTIWVDAVCINQGDNTEKAEQVSLMREIYERASRTVVWLGPAEGQTHIALTMCLRMLDLHGNAYFGKQMGENQYEVFDKMIGEISEEPSVVARRRQLYLRNRIKLWSDHGSNLDPTDVENAARDALHADITARAPHPGIDDWVGSFTGYLYATPPPPTTLGDVEIPRQLQTPEFLQLATQHMPNGTDRPMREEAAAVRALFSRPWFNRIWIVQETVMAKEVVFNYASNNFPGWAIYAGLLIACDFDPTLKLLLMPFNIVWAFRRSLCRHPGHRHAKHKGKRDLISLLQSFRFRDATDPHDKIYALLGITSDDSEKLGIHIHYDRPVAQTYTETAISILNSTKDLSIIDLIIPTGTPISGLPSWVPDWSDTALPLPALYGMQDFATMPYAATGDSVRGSFEATLDGRLRLSGFECDIVTEAGAAMPKVELEMDAFYKISTPCRPETMSDKLIPIQRVLGRLRERMNIYQAWEALIDIKDGGMGSYPTGESAMQVYKQTLEAAPDTASTVTMEAFQAWQANRPQYSDILAMIENQALDSNSLVNGIPTIMSMRFLLLANQYTQLPRQLEFSCTVGRRLVRTANGYLGLAPGETQIGDSIILLKGAKTPIVARCIEDEWIMVGPAYIHGMMYQELWDEDSCQDLVFI